MNMDKSGKRRERLDKMASFPRKRESKLILLCLVAFVEKQNGFPLARE
jgi:hypothetical protein